MKVSTQIIAGYIILLLLMFGAVGYELLLVQRMQTISNDLSATHFPASLTGIRLEESLRDVDEFATKFLLVDREGYDAGFQASRAAFRRVFGEMASLATSEEGALALERLDATWQEFISSVDDAATSGEPDTFTFLPVRIEDQLRRMYSQVDVVYGATEGTVTRELARSLAINDRATRVSWIAAALALILSGTVAIPIVRSISGGLARLTEGTRWLSEGRLTRRIPEDRNDEFGELAGSFNKMADRLEELDQLKKDFVSSVSHEIKSPIASSREIVQLLLDEVPGPLNDEQKRLLELSIRSSRRLVSLMVHTGRVLRVPAASSTTSTISPLMASPSAIASLRSSASS